MGKLSQIADKMKAKKNQEQAQGKKKSRKKLFIIIGVIVVLGLGGIMASASASGAGFMVETHTVGRGEVEAVLSTSGTVESGEEIVYYSPITADIGSVNVKAGDAVKAGDVLITYDEKSLAMLKDKASLQLIVSNGEYKDTLQRDGKMQAELTEANVNLEVLNQQIADYEALIKQEKRRLEDKKRARQATLAARQQDLDTDTSISANELMEAQAQLNYENTTWQGESQFVEIERTIEDAQEILENLNEYKAEMEAQQSATEDSVMSASMKEAKQAGNQITQMEQENVLGDAEDVSSGIVAKTDGIVVSVNTVNGAPITDGAEMLRIKSTQDVHVAVSLSKYDLEKAAVGQKVDITAAGHKYEGEVSRINRMAQLNANNMSVVYAEISINNPDENLILGIEAKVTIHGNKAEDAIVVPVESVNADKDGDFVYVVEDGVVARKDVVMGISSDEYAEICEGLNEGDEIITSITGEIEEGMAVTIMPKEESTESSAEEAIEETTASES